MKYLKIVLFLSIGFAMCAHAQRATVFPAPRGVAESEFYKVAADSQPVFVYATYRQDKFSKEKIGAEPVSPLSFCIFDFEKNSDVVLNVKKGVIENPSAAVVRPLADKVACSVDMSNQNFDVVKIKLEKVGNYTFDPRGDGSCAIHIFTNTPEKSRPDKTAANVKYFGAGVHKVESLVLKSGDVLYLEGGAVLECAPKVVKGKRKHRDLVFNNMDSPIKIEDAENITICGRGIISCAGSIQRGERMSPFTIRSIRNLKIKDILMLESNEWNIALFDVKDAEIDNLKIVAFFVNSDGICPSGNCDNIRVKNCFVHNADDGYEVKSMDSFWGWIPTGKERYFGPVRNVSFENCQVWSDLATPMGVTHEIAHPVENITYKNITILHHISVVGPYPVRGHIALFPAGGGTVSNLLFENIVLESSQSKYKNCININNFHGDSWRKNTPRYDTRPFSRVENITFRNISFNALTDKIGLYNSGSGDEIKNIKFENVTVNGKAIDESNVDAKNADFTIVKTSKK